MNPNHSPRLYVERAATVAAAAAAATALYIGFAPGEARAEADPSVSVPAADSLGSPDLVLAADEPADPGSATAVLGNLPGNAPRPAPERRGNTGGSSPSSSPEATTSTGASGQSSGQSGQSGNRRGQTPEQTPGQTPAESPAQPPAQPSAQTSTALVELSLPGNAPRPRERAPTAVAEAPQAKPEIVLPEAPVIERNEDRGNGRNGNDTDDSVIALPEAPTTSRTQPAEDNQDTPAPAPALPPATPAPAPAPAPAPETETSAEPLPEPEPVPPPPPPAPEPAPAPAPVEVEAAAPTASLPSNGRITSQFGERTDPFGSGEKDIHWGVDFVGGCDAPIFAADAGVVTKSGPSGSSTTGFGNSIHILHANGDKTVYGHMEPGKLFVKVGDQVAAGQEIALEGSYGSSTGCHLHFEVYIGGSRDNRIDPLEWLRARGVDI